MFRRILTAGTIAVTLVTILLMSSIIRAGAEEHDNLEETGQEIQEDEITEVSEESSFTEDILEETVAETGEMPEEEADTTEAGETSEATGVNTADIADAEEQDEEVQESEEGSREVADWDELLAALSDAEVSEIVFLNDIARNSASSGKNPGTINRSLKIDGNNHTLTITSGYSAATSPILLGTVAEGDAVLEISNLSYGKTYGANVALFTQSSAGWTIKAENVSTASGNAAALINAADADVELDGTSSLVTTGTQDVIKARNITVKQGATLYAEEKGAGGILKASESLIFEQGAEVTAVGAGADSLFSAAEMVISEAAQVEGSISSPSGRPSVYYADEVVLAEKARMKGVVSGEAYGMSTGDLTIAPGADAQFLSSGAACVAVYIRKTGSIRIADAALTIENTGSRITSSYTHSGSGGIYGNAAEVEFDNARVTIETAYDSIAVSENCDFSIINGSQVVLNSARGTCLEMNAGGSSGRQKHHLLIKGETTDVDMFSGNRKNDYDGSAVYIKGDDSLVEVLDGAYFHVIADNGTTNYNSAVQIEGAGAVLNVRDKAVMRLWTAKSTSAYSPILRFRLQGGMTLDIDDAEVYLESEGGSANGIRMYGGNNAVKVTNGGYLYIHNPGSGTRKNDGTNTGIRYHSGGSSASDTFLLEGENEEGTGSTVEIVADSGSAIYSGSSAAIEVTAGKNTIFELTGNTASGSNGVINCSSGALSLQINEPAYFDFKNKNYKTPAISTSNSSSTFHAENTAISLWRKESDWTLSPTKNIRWMTEMNLRGANFGTIVSVDENVAEEFKAEYSGRNMLSYNRVSSNNARAVVDELRIGTDADQHIYGHVMVPEGRGQELRDAYTDEVFVLVEVLEDGKSLYGQLKGSTRGMGDSEDGIDVFGLDGERGGIFEIELPDGAYLEEGQTVQVVGAWRGNDADTWADAMADTTNIISRDEDMLAEPVTVQHVIPPTALTLDDLDPGLLSDVEDSDEKVLSTRATSVYGTSAEIGASVYVYKNGELLNEGKEKVGEDEKWQVDFPAETALEINDIIAIALNDDQPVGELAAADEEFLQSRTRMNGGNENPAAVTQFHDMTFARRIYLRVEPAGTLELYAPETLDFGRKSISPLTKSYKVENIDQEELGVLDTRLTKNTWSLYLSMDQQITHENLEDYQLTDALCYVKDGEEMILSENEALLVITDQNENHEEFYDLYDRYWYKKSGDGLWLTIPGGTGRTGTYQGSVTWTLLDVPGNE